MIVHGATVPNTGWMARRGADMAGSVRRSSERSVRVFSRVPDRHFGDARGRRERWDACSAQALSWYGRDSLL